MSSIENQYLFHHIDPLDGSKNFLRWKDRVLLRLHTLGISYVVLTEPCPSDDQLVETADDDSLCRGHILNTLTDRLFDLHVHRKTAKELWDALERTYGIEDEVSKCLAVERFADFKMVDDEPVLDQLCKIEGLVSDIESQGKTMTENDLAVSIVGKLPPSWEKFQRSLMDQSTDLSMDRLWEVLRREEVTRRFVKLEMAGNGVDSVGSDSDKLSEED